MSESQTPLPDLREELVLMEGGRDWRGAPTWLIHDPFRNQYYQVDENGFALLNVWGEGSLEAVQEAAHERFGKWFSESDINAFYEFLVDNQLVFASDSYLRERLTRLRKQKQVAPWKWMAQKYLFFRIPLVRPDRVLGRLYRLARPLISVTFVRISIVVGLIGLFMTLQRWQEFINNVPWFFSAEGLVVFGMTLVGVKILHELGHGLLCKHYRLRVPTMGVAFMVMWPVLYTDATDAWTLRRRRDRALIDSGGVITELLLACYALFLWPLMTDGLARSVVFAVATTTLVLSLAVNLNPFMRFDGYYFLADWLNIANLQPRGFALAKWQLRRWLFNIQDEPPERFSPRMHGYLVAYAIGTWIYRFFLFLGIALLVYEFFFKALGIILFLVELWWFLARPIYNEVKNWRHLVSTMSGKRRLGFILAFTVVLLLVVIPWRDDIVVPAQMGHREFKKIFVPSGGRVVKLHVQEGDEVAADAPLINIDSPKLEHELRVAQLKVEELESVRDRSIGSEEMLSKRLVAQEKLGKARSKVSSLERRKSNLDIRSPFAGTVATLNQQIHEGRWVPEDEHIMTLVGNSGGYGVFAWIREEDVGRISPDSRAEFFSRGGYGPMALDLELESIGQSALSELEHPLHASTFGGEIPVKRDREGRLVPELGIYRLRLVPATDLDPAEVPPHRVKGWVRLEGERRSLLTRFSRWVIGSLIRETGF